MVQILTNHVGYDTGSTKTAVFQGEKGTVPAVFSVLRRMDDEVVFTGTAVEAGEVDRWGTGWYSVFRFDEVRTPGDYVVSAMAGGREYRSFPFRIDTQLLELRTLSAVAYYFKAQRITGEMEAADRALPFRPPREGAQDVRGGWYDATGDYGSHLSHLSHTTYFNPQQAAFSAYGFFKIHDLLEESGQPNLTMVKRRLLDEAIYGADFLMRMRAPSGTFFRSKARSDAFLPLGTYAGSRTIASEFRNPKTRVGGGVTEGFDEIRNENYEVSFRSGGGYSVAALAYAARTVYPGAFSQAEYIAAAVSAFAFLEAHNDRFTNDGKTNLVDEYCALDASVELYKSTRLFDYLRKARVLADRILSKAVSVGPDSVYLSVDGTSRPFFHAADAGMPVVNLLNYHDIDPDPGVRSRVLAEVSRLMRHELEVTSGTVNPFGYARQRVQDGHGTISTRFFYPHDVETAPWWQGENARIASLAAAARALARKVEGPFRDSLRKYADDQINWILGLNPFDSCMMEGAGRNTNAYFFGDCRDFVHCPGGIVNGITAGLDDEVHGISFVTEPVGGVSDNWRWAEQWIPHATWYLYALALQQTPETQNP